MADRWANSGVDLHLDLDLRRPRKSLERAVREAVRDGRLAPGTPLPASRVLSADLRIARNTVVEAYAQLIAEGWLTARRGSVTRVAERALPTSSQPRSGIDRPPSSRGSRYDLRPGVPDLAAFPRDVWLAAQRRALVAAPHDLLGYDPAGPAAVRTTLAESAGWSFPTRWWTRW
jgi:GntR family transcriptional regulator / MocR family aminotransferase